MGRVKAAIVGAREITSAAVAASLAILAIFIPVIFMKGIIGKFFFQFGVTMSVAVMLSLLEALTLTPDALLAAPSRRAKRRSVGPFMDRFMGCLSRAIPAARSAWCLDNRWKVLGVAAAHLRALPVPARRDRARSLSRPRTRASSWPSSGPPSVHRLNSPTRSLKRSKSMLEITGRK